MPNNTMDNKQSEITCNSCGKIETITEDSYEEDRFHAIELIFGYGSSYDGETWSFKLCEQCIVDYVSRFKHRPKKETWF